MCGRYNLNERGISRFTTDLRATWHSPVPSPRYNIAPTQHAPVVFDVAGERQAQLFRWGLIPFWAKDASFGSRAINARSEQAHAKPAFRAAFRSRRCLVPASGFYEWKRTPDGKVPHHIFSEDGLLTFAGLWESWSPATDAEPIQTFTILTTGPSEFMRALHDRMPVILDGEARDTWLDPSTPQEQLQEMLRPAPEDRLRAQPVSTRVNSPRNEGPELVEPLEV